MAFTFLQLVNSVQLRLRETQTAAVNTNAYASLLAQYVNDAKREVEDAWNWNCLRDTVVVTTAADTRAYVITGSRNRARIIDVYNNTSNVFLCPVGGSGQTNSMIGSEATGEPTAYTFNGEYEGDLIADLYPIPDGVYAINFNLVIPQDDLALGTDTIRVPHWLVVLGAYAKAVSERGEDSAGHYDRAMLAYSNALSDAISQDESRMVYETDWVAR